ncbi:MAG TPA: hypothetical protein VNK95_19340, partial [Caldilineaceae bacterium]|nr:hypothetical protein [Caldilineaceae bacterium]
MKHIRLCFYPHWRRLWPWLATLGLLLTAQSVWAGPVAQDPTRLLLAGSRYVYHPSLYGWSVQAFLETHAPALATLVVETDGGPLSLADAILVQAHYTSLNPQLLLALMDYRSGLLSTATPTQEQIDRAFGYTDPASLGFRRQLARAAEELFDAFYFFYYDDPALQGAADSAATAALLSVLTGKRDPASWSEADWAAGYRVQERFAFYFGNPLPAISVAAGGERPVWRLPWPPGEQWRYGQGPHRNNPASSDTRLVAVDFVPTGSL